MVSVGRFTAAAAAAGSPRASKSGQRCTTVMKASTASSRYAVQLEVACQAVRLASHLCRTSQRQLKLSEEATAKDDLSPVTVADLGAQAIVSWALQNLPKLDSTTTKTKEDEEDEVSFSLVAEEDSDFLRSEEGKELRRRVVELVNETLESMGMPGLSEAEILRCIDKGKSPGGGDAKHWVLDPIDGTRGFVADRQYAIALALLDKGEPVLGVLGCPNLSLESEDLDVRGKGSGDTEGGYLFLAERNQGAFAVGIETQVEGIMTTTTSPSTSSSSTNSSGSFSSQQQQQQQRPKRISVSEVEAEEAIYMESVESRHSDHAFARRVAETCGIKIEPLRLDSQVKYGVIASGVASAFMRFPDLTYKEKIWDHAAGAIIMSEAGGLVTDSTGKKLDFSKGRLLNNESGIVAAPPKLHSKIIAAIKSLQANT